MLELISPIDGRYGSKTKELQSYFSEYALIKYRLKVEILYFRSLVEAGLPQLTNVSLESIGKIENEIDNLTVDQAQEVKNIEKTTNHDVKAVEYYLKDMLKAYGIVEELEFIHFGLTSQDINNTAFPLMIGAALDEVLVPALQHFVNELSEVRNQWQGIPMLARTHGQAASPTTLGKEIHVYIERLDNQIDKLLNLDLFAKFGGATGNLNAHLVSFPDTNWIEFANHFVTDKLNLVRHQTTTQIAHYDDLANLFHTLSRINTIFIDLARDMWTYISMDYFKQKVVKNEVGSSAMPHKVNPIDWENAEGNLGLANAIFGHLAEKLPISRLQRDLTDSTVLRNVGIPFGHMLIALKSLEKALGKLSLNEDKIEADLENNWAVVAEAIQNILRREQIDKPYEKLKALTRGSRITKSKISEFIETLEVSDDVKRELSAISPHNYVGYYDKY